MNIKRLHTSLIAWCFLLSWGGHVALGQAAEDSEYSADRRSLHELLAFDWTRIDDSADSDVWVLLRVCRDKPANARFGELQKAVPEAIETQDGTPDPRTGTGEVISELKGRVAENNWPCLWTIRRDAGVPVVGNVRPPPEAGYEKFRHSQFVIATVKQGPDPWRMIDPVCLIPDAWKDSVGPAHDFLKTHRDLFAPKDEGGLAALGKLMDEPNPIIACVACKAFMTKTHEQTPQAVFDQIAKSTDMRQAFFVHALMDHLKPMPDDATKATIDRLSNLVDATSKMDQLKGLALGCSTDLGQSHPLPVNKPAFRVLQRVEEKYIIMVSAINASSIYVYESTEPIENVRRIMRMFVEGRKGALKEE